MERLINLTIGELYDWAVNNGVENYVVLIQYRDEGGDYCGVDNEIFGIIDDKEKTVTL